MPRNGHYSDEQFIAAWESNGFSPAKVARALGITERSVYSRRLALEGAGIILPSAPRDGTPIGQWTYPKQIDRTISDGVIIVGSDAHIWPGEDTTALKALLEVTRDLGKSVRLLVANGDWLDGASTNRHDPFGWVDRPNAKQELDCVTDALHRWRMAAKPARTGVECDYTVGNHELNFERKLAVQAKDYRGLPGMRLADHFPEWNVAWSCRVNWGTVGATMIKHRFASSGIHAAYNATLKAGTNTVNGHTHSLEVKPWADYRGRRYACQSGSLADPNGPQFEYHEQNPSPSCSGFAVLTFKDGRLLMPELCEVIEGRAYFRGQVVIDDSAAMAEAA